VWSIQPISSAHFCKKFKCGHHQLDHWLVRWAVHNENLNATRTKVLLEAGSNDVKAFYALSATNIDAKHLPSDVQALLNLKYPAPAILLSQLAVRKDMAGKGVGKMMLVHALRTAREASDRIGAFAIAVEAIDENAREFYQKFGFITMERDDDHDIHLFLPMSAVP
jgi:GNAT superfamily N-acetyltransferase